MAAFATRQFVLLPREGFIATPASPAFNTLVNLPQVQSLSEAKTFTLAGESVRILDTLREDGPKLVELDAKGAAAVNAPTSPLRAEPVIEYGIPDPRPQPLGGMSAALATGLTSVTITCVDASTKSKVAGADVVAFSNYAARSGDQGTTGADGRVTLRLAGTTIERLYVYPPRGYWGAFRWNETIRPSMEVPLTAVDLAFVDCLRSYYGASRFNAGIGVTVGIVDTGVGPHSDLNIVGGSNTVTGENAGDYQDSHGHGTHVAGIIGANGTPPNGLRGMAPAIQLQAYRVFGQGSSGATNYAILKAMLFAQMGNCDILNLSLGGGPYDEIVSEAIQDARNHGMLIVIAAGNNGRAPVNYPAAYPGATAVSALGCEGTFPVGSLEEVEVLRPPNSVVDPREFIAEFSNIGPQIAVTAPGVGVISTLPNNGFGPMSGTSMAAPVAAGAAACLLSRDPATYSMRRDRSRSDAIERLLQAHAVRRQFGSVYEGYGLPDPSEI
jgi:subtilisin